MSSEENTTYPAKCSSLRIKGYVMIKKRPCKIAAMSTSAPGKHGHAKVHLVAFDLFTGKRLEDVCPATHNIQVPVVSRRDYTLLYLAENGEQLGLLSEAGDAKEVRADLSIPRGELGERIVRDHKNGLEVTCTVIEACGEEAVIEVKSKLVD